MTDKDKIKCAVDMYNFWRLREHVIYLMGSHKDFSAEEIRLFFCEVLSYYLDGKEGKHNVSSNNSR